ncbi:hypothetical protein PHLCEN_2v3851 [Hermanssonia centrifuga]|uniref:Uncharacterized protein n=1 Tax=Hermanssonia centrifuga TaxID=98765 RepID=A0A2R6QBC7_9APHY|nr:hypothetical protein PHLCEN_2v3851 [Hermanssonia centrifuga]
MNLGLHAVEHPTNHTEAVHRLKQLASAFREKLGEGITFKQHGQYRRKFHSDVCQVSSDFRLNAKKKTHPPTDVQNMPSTGHTIVNQGLVGSAMGKAGTEDEFPDGILGHITEVAEALMRFLDPTNQCRGLPLAVFCFDESQSLTDPVANVPWTRFSELCRGFRCLRNLPFWAVFLSTAGKFHLFPPEKRYGSSTPVMSDRYQLYAPVTETGFDDFADRVAADGS